MNDSIRTLAALAQETRLAAFRLLVKAGTGGMPAGELAHALSVPQNTLSAHLSVLASAGLVAGTRDGRSVIYRAEMGRMASLMDFLTEDCCGGRPELCAPTAKPCCPPEPEPKP